MVKNLIDIQSKLKAPKGQYNSFGKYRYRSCEDILEAVKPLLRDAGCTLTITDDIITVQNRIYVKATATIKDAEGNTESVTAFAREPEGKKGMDESQVTGTASSYARKYALNGLFLIDDTKDADTDENRNEREGRAAQQSKQQSRQKPQQEPRQEPDPEPQQEFTDNARLANINVIKAAFGDNLPRLLAQFKVKSLDQMTDKQIAWTMNYINQQRNN
jgi:hypothetical protein